VYVPVLYGPRIGRAPATPPTTSPTNKSMVPHGRIAMLWNKFMVQIARCVQHCTVRVDIQVSDNILILFKNNSTNWYSLYTVCVSCKLRLHFAHFH
jgi:hypothetical protein